MKPLDLRKPKNKFALHEGGVKILSNENENPFKKGPKLHLFKKSRRLKTSSATRTDEEGYEGASPTEYPTTMDGWTITTGAAYQNDSKAVYGVADSKTGPETNNTTI